MSICNENIKPIVFSEEIATENIKKKYGLFPINDIKPTVNICSEIFEGPEYYTNLTKLNTGLTENSIGVFNITNTGMTANFVFTGNTDTLTAYTGYFEYNLYERSLDFIPPEVNVISGFDFSQPQIFNTNVTYSASTPFTAITENPYKISDNLGVLIVKDQEYIINSNNKFIKNNCLFKGQTYSEPNLGPKYDKDSSWYFVTLIDPEIPRLGPFKPIPTRTPSNLTVREITRPNDKPTYVFAVPTKETTSDNCKLINENLTISPINGTSFSISKKPSPNTLLVSVNGITLSNLDYTISADTIINLTESLDPNRDIITASYLDCGTDLNTVYSEQYKILSAITSGPTSAVTTTDKVYYNTEQSKYEYYLDYTPDDAEDTMSLFLNGVKLTYGIDYYLSTSVNNRVIFDGITLVVSDTIYVVYTSDGTLEGDYDIVNGDVILNWEVNEVTVNDRLSGNFLVEITENDDPNFTSTGVTTGITVNYIGGQTEYDVNLPKTIEANKSYIWRVNSKKVYSGILDNIFITRSVSRIGKFKTNNEINSY
jgi:hypothetical protein